MEKHTVAGYIHIRFSDADFSRYRGALEMIAGIKERIPQEQRSYDSKSREWTVDDTPENQAKISELYQDIFADKNQMKLFE